MNRPLNVPHKSCSPQSSHSYFRHGSYSPLTHTSHHCAAGSDGEGLCFRRRNRSATEIRIRFWTTARTDKLCAERSTWSASHLWIKLAQLLLSKHQEILLPVKAIFYFLMPGLLISFTTCFIISPVSMKSFSKNHYLYKLAFLMWWVTQNTPLFVWSR